MKNKFSLLLSSLLLLAFVSCKKEETKDYYEGGTAPKLTASTTSVTLEPGQEAKTALTLNWTNPEYQFTSGPSSLDVTYTLELDTMGANFSSSKKNATVIAKDLNKTFTVAELNGILGNTMLLQLDPRRSYNMQMRVVASIGSAVKLPSNAINFTTRPFAPPPKVPTPTNETLWITGDAVSGPGYNSWSNPIPAPYDQTFKFTKVSTTLYQLTLNMPGGGGYKLIQENGVWGSQYHMVTGTWDGGDFEKKDSDPQFPGPPSAGQYKITVNFQTGKYTVVKL